MNLVPIIELLRRRLPSLLAIYLFGSRAQGHATAGSDLDLAVFVEGVAEPVQLFETASDVADLAGCEVDLIDLRAASTVMQHQIITTGTCLWTRDSNAAIYESFILSEKTNLDEARAHLLDEIKESGKVYGR